MFTIFLTATFGGERFNVVYWLPLRRCGTEWDQLRYLNAGDRLDQEKQAEEKLKEIKDIDNKRKAQNEELGRNPNNTFIQNNIANLEGKRADLVNDVSGWRIVLGLYTAFCCVVRRDVNGVRGIQWPFALFLHNWLGCLRMWIYLSALLLIWSATLQIHTGHYNVFASDPQANITWPVYIARWDFPPPGWNMTQQIFPPLGASSSDNIDSSNDTSAWMYTAASVMVAAEFFRLCSYIAYWVGIVRNESSMPRGHLHPARLQSAIRFWLP